MPHVIAWYGFLGAWLLIAGPLEPELVFRLGVVGMLVICIALTVGRTRRRHRRPAVEG